MGLLQRIFGRHEKALWPRDVSSVPGYGGGGWVSILEPFTGAWQRNISVRADSVLTHSIVFACIKLISSDVAKLRMRLVAQYSDQIWREVISDSPFWPVLRKPNHWQTRIQFWENWISSKLIHGNTYVLKERDERGIVVRLYVLDPMRVTIRVGSEDGAVFYELNTDRLAGIGEQTIIVPAREVIHDRWNCFNHPLVGISPISAAGLSATQGLALQQAAAKLAEQGGLPSGLLKTPHSIKQEDCKRIEQDWMEKYGPRGTARGAVAVVGGGLEFQPMTMTAVDAQVIEQLRWSDQQIIAVFGVPGYKVGIGQPPTYNNIEALNQSYYNDCLQILLEAAEACMDDGLELARGQGGLKLGTEFDTEAGLFRMDSQARSKVAAEGIKAGALSPDEARSRYFDLGPVKGGDTPYLQQQMYSLSALAERDADKPFSKPAPAVPAVQGPEVGDGNGGAADDDGESEPAESEDEERSLDEWLWNHKLAARSEAA